GVEPLGLIVTRNDNDGSRHGRFLPMVRGSEVDASGQERRRRRRRSRARRGWVAPWLRLHRLPGGGAPPGLALTRNPVALAPEAGRAKRATLPRRSSRVRR